MDKPVVQITLEAWRKIRGYVLASDIECSMLAEVETKNNRFVISKVYLPKQTRSAAFTKITHDGVAELLTTEGVDPSKIKAWFHSHVNMGVTPSGVDVTQAKELMADAEWFIRGIFNKKNEYSMHVHWMGIEMEAEMQISYDGTYDFVKIRQELEDVTVKEFGIPVTVYEPQSDGTYKPLERGSKKNKSVTNGFAYKCSEHLHRQQNKYLDKEAIDLYADIEEAPSFGAFMWRGFKEYANTSKKTELQYFASLYTEFLVGLNYGWTMPYCYRMVQETLEKDQKRDKALDGTKELQTTLPGVT